MRPLKKPKEKTLRDIQQYLQILKGNDPIGEDWNAMDDTLFRAIGLLEPECGYTLNEELHKHISTIFNPLDLFREEFRDVEEDALPLPDWRCMIPKWLRSSWKKMTYREIQLVALVSYEASEHVSEKFLGTGEKRNLV